MTTASRPAPGRKQTRTTEKKADDELDSGVQITLAGETYTVRQGDLTSRLERELRREYGGSFDALKRELAVDTGVDSIATFVWLARRIAGEQIRLDDVEISYRDMLDGDLDVEVVGPAAEGDDSPEA